MRGATSRTVIHPSFIPAAAGLGVHFHTVAGHPHTAVRLHVKHDQLAFEQLAEITKGGDVSLKVHAFLYVATGNLWFKASREYLTKACIALNVAKLQFIPDTRRPPELIEDVHERLATPPGYLFRALLVFGRGRIGAKNDGPNREGVPA